MQEESDAIVKHYNRVVKGKQCGADGYIPQVWFQNTLHYLTISVYGGINRKKWRKLIHSAVRSPADDFSIYKEWKENPLSKRTWLSYLAIREYEWRVLACAHVRAISAIVHHRIHRHLHSVVVTPPSLSKAEDEVLGRQSPGTFSLVKSKHHKDFRCQITRIKRLKKKKSIPLCDCDNLSLAA